MNTKMIIFFSSSVPKAGRCYNNIRYSVIVYHSSGTVYANECDCYSQRRAQRDTRGTCKQIDAK